MQDAPWFRLELISQWIKIGQHSAPAGLQFRLELISQWIKMNLSRDKWARMFRLELISQWIKIACAGAHL